MAHVQMYAISIAHEFEEIAYASANRFNYGTANESKGLFEAAGIEVHYSGIGKVNAAFKAFDVIQKTGCQYFTELRARREVHILMHMLWLKWLSLYNVIWMYRHWVLTSG